MQERVVDSLYTLPRSSVGAEHSTRTAQNRKSAGAAKRSRWERFLGFVILSVIGGSLCCGSAIIGTAGQSVDPNNILLDFSAPWCGPCQEMSPIVTRLERQGYSIRKVDIEQERDLANQFQVTNIPCFILVANGREVTRMVGKTDERRLKELLAMLPRKDDANGDKSARNNTRLNATNGVAAAPVSDKKGLPKLLPLFGKNNDKNNDLKLTSTNTADTVRGQNPNQDVNQDRYTRDPLAASTRIRIKDGPYDHYGSGTVIDSQPGRSVILTCGHIFRNLGKKALVEVDYCPNDQAEPQTFIGQIVKFDLSSDVGILTIPSPNRLPVMKLADVNLPLNVRDRVISVGCGGGSRPAVERHSITGVNRYEGPDNLECDKAPDKGRSGGGLFIGSELVGICIAADYKEDRGIYTSLKPVMELLAQSSLGQLMPNSGFANDSIAKIDMPKGKAAPKFDQIYDDIASRGGSALADTILDSDRGSGLGKLESEDYVGAQITCVISPKTPGAPTRIIVVNQATSRFVDDLLHDSKGDSRKDLAAAMRKTPKSGPVEKQPTNGFELADLPSNSGKASARGFDSNDDESPVETSFEPQRYRRIRN